MKLPKFDIIDGGYLTYVFGLTAWGQASWPPSYAQGPLIMMDGPEKTIREIQFPPYKSARRAKRAADPNYKKAHERVSLFRKAIEEDPRIRIIRVPGLEADDLVILGAWATKKKSLVLGIDKDLLQASPYLKMYDHHGEQITRKRFQARLAKALQGKKLRGKHIPMILSILGDKSDSVPRLLDKRELWLLWRLLWEKSQPDWHTAYKKFGADLLLNLYTVILPHPSCFDLNKASVFDLVSNGNWNPKTLMPKLLPVYKEMVKSWSIV